MKRLVQLTSSQWNNMPDPRLGADAKHRLEEEQRLWRHLHTLPPREQRVLSLRFGLTGQRLTVREAAERMAMSKSSVQRLEQQALAHMRQAYGLPRAA